MSSSIKTKSEREEAFKRDLKELLTKHDAELQITDDGKPFGLSSAICVISMMSKWDADGSQTHEYTEFYIK